MRYLGVKGTDLGTFLVNWYGGVVLAAAFLFLATPDEQRAVLPPGDWPRVFGLSLSVLVTMSTAFWAYRLAPQTVVQPLFLVGEMAAPALVGLYVCAEREALDRIEQCSFAPGLGGRPPRGSQLLLADTSGGTTVSRACPSACQRRVLFA